MDRCEEWMKSPMAKCLYWGLILLVLMIVIFYLRNPEGFSVGTLEGCAHGQCKNLQDTVKLFVGQKLGVASITNVGKDNNEEPFVGTLEGCAHGKCKDLYDTNTLFKGQRLGHGITTNVGRDYNEEPFKLPPGSEHMGIPGPSREALLDVEDFKKAGTGNVPDPLDAALAGGSALNVPPTLM